MLYGKRIQGALLSNWIHKFTLLIFAFIFVKESYSLFQFSQNIDYSFYLASEHFK
jgi:hypothetical protein